VESDCDRFQSLIYVNRKFSSSSLHQVQYDHPDLTAIKIWTAESQILIFSVYPARASGRVNEKTGKHRRSTLYSSRLPHKTRVSRKIDYAFAFSVRDQQIKTMYDSFAVASPNQTISQTTDPFTKRVALFSGVEVKQSNGGEMEALAQLSIWLASGLEKLLQLSNLQGKGVEHSPLLPTLGWTVVGHDRHLYLAFRGIFEGQERIVSEVTAFFCFLFC
jgi:hypothetical protein